MLPGSRRQIDASGRAKKMLNYDLDKNDGAYRTRSRGRGGEEGPLCDLGYELLLEERGHKYHPPPPPVLAFNFYRA